METYAFPDRRLFDDAIDARLSPARVLVNVGIVWESLDRGRQKF